MLKLLIFYNIGDKLMFKLDQPIVALFGGSFDPPHIGHIGIIDASLQKLDIDKLIVIPAYLNPFKSSSMATASMRLEWVKKIFKRYEKVEVSDFEINQNKVTTTFESVNYFSTHYEVKYFIIGADNLSKITLWSQFEWLNCHLTWVIAKRKGYNIDTTNLKNFIILEVSIDNISSTQLRDGEKLDYIDKSVRDEISSFIKNKEI
jgi:nicotinate-nucleotide adenylyltransferase